MYTPTPSVLKTNRLLGIVSALVLLVGGVAIADIISGLSTTNSSSNVTITNLTLTKPADVVVGNFMLAAIAVRDGDTVSVTAPQGWTQILRTDNAADIGIVSYWKIAGASEPASYNWTLSPQTRAQGGITRYQGVDVADPIDTAAGNTGRGTTATGPSITTTTDNAEVVALYALRVGGINHAGSFFSTPVGMTEKYDSSYTAAGPTIASDDMVQITAGATGDKVSTISGTQQRDWAAQLIALRPAASSTLLNGLIHYWKLDESSGDAFDSVGGMTMTNVNSTSYIPGKLANGIDIEFDNLNTLTTATNLQNTPLNQYTACAWLRPESTPVANDSYVFFTSYDAPGTWDMRYINIDGTLHLKLNHFTDGDTVDIVHPTVLPVGEWAFFCGTWDGTQIQMHLNGSPVGPSAPVSVARTTESNGTYIGSQSGLQQWDGLIDEVAIWNRALSTADIGQLYNSGTGLTYPF